MPPSHQCTSVSISCFDSCHRHCFSGRHVAISSSHTYTTSTPMGEGKCLVSLGPEVGLLSHTCLWKLLYNVHCVPTSLLCYCYVSPVPLSDEVVSGECPLWSCTPGMLFSAWGRSLQAAVQLVSTSSPHHALVPALGAPVPSRAPIKYFLIPLPVSVLPGRVFR